MEKRKTEKMEKSCFVPGRVEGIARERPYGETFACSLDAGRLLAVSILFLLLEMTGFKLVTGELAIARQSATDPVVVTHEEEFALEVVARRIYGYNMHDTDTFLAAHAEDVQIIEYPDKRIGEGRSHLEWVFGPQFAQGMGAIEILYQTAIGNTVVSHERISIGDEIETLVAIYTVEDEVIATIRLIETED